MIARDGIFREYDIRGVVGQDFDSEFALELGRAFSDLIWDNFKKEVEQRERPMVAIGFDCRTSAPVLSKALIRGITEGGVDVINSGMGPTPQVYYMVVAKKLSGGIQITASHNPGDQNGFKSMVGLKTLSGPDIQDLKRRTRAIAEKGFTPNRGAGQERGEDARAMYTQELIVRSRSQMGKRKLRVVVDGGNGVGGLVGPQLLRELGCEVIELFTEPDGRFPNHHPDPTVLDNIVEMRRVVVEQKADLGIAWDGDADRIGVVDEQANPIWGDMLLVVFGRQLLSEVKNPIIIGDVKCSELMFSDLRARGANTVMSKTGHSLIKAKIRELGAHLAGEMSGHMFFVHRYFGFDDALHASARLVEILSNTEKKMSELLADLPKMVSTPEIRVDCADEYKFQVAEKAKSLFPDYETITIDGVRVKFPNGWGLVRASNTQPVLVMRFEADTAEHLREYQTLVQQRIEKLKREL